MCRVYKVLKTKKFGKFRGFWEQRNRGVRKRATGESGAKNWSDESHTFMLP